MYRFTVFCLISLLSFSSCLGLDWSGEENVDNEVKGLYWTWLSSGIKESATKQLVYEETFGNRAPLRLNQSICVFGDRAFCFNHGNECLVLDMHKQEWIYTVILPDKSHHNNAQFLNIYYDKTDKYPLLLLSRGDYPPNQNDLYVVRVIEEGQTISFTLIKTIHNSLLEAKNNGSWVVDDIQGKLFLYCMTSGDWRVKKDNKFCVFSFSLPNLLSTADLTLGYEDVLDKWEYTYLIHQGGTYFNGYLLFNVQSLTYINEKRVESSKSVLAINSNNGNVELILPLDDSKETEGISVYNDKLYVSFKDGAEEQNPNNIVFTLSQYSLPASMVKDN